MKKAFGFLWQNFELFFWIGALLSLFFMEPAGDHFSLCPLKNMGFEYCPGCGLGHSIHYAMRLDIADSFTNHPLGIFGLVVIILRIYKLIKLNFKTNYHGHQTATTYSGR
ncbi:MAG: DUF2752 domain-containing protein [Chlorobi bacterium]|nr:DUF2752 domain-containing protein [Chlorobiota bacterium]